MIHSVDTSENDTLVPGCQLGDVQLGDLIGAGASSEVYDATSPTSRKRCAVKVFRHELAIRAVSRGRYEHVAHRVDQLGHSGIAATYGFGNTPDGRSYAVLEHAPGQPLGQLVGQAGALSRSVSVAIMRQICSTVAVAHAHGIPHLRLHRGNVMVDMSARGTPRVTLLDFGVCQLHPPLPEPPSALELRPEHALWIAPEQARGDAGDTRSDVYALSVLLYELVCGRVPFLGNSYKETLELQLSAPILPPSKLAKVPAELEATILRGLEKDPRRRIPSAEALLSAIDPLSATTGQHQVLAKTHQTRKRTLSTGEYQLHRTGEHQTKSAADDPLRASAPSAARHKGRLALIIGLSCAFALFVAVILWSILN